jgi:gliding motility-associated-like protein
MILYNSKKLSFTLIAALLALYSFAANITSTAGGGNWNSAATWVGGVIPGAGDNVTIAGNVTVNANASATNVTINAGSTLTCSNAGLSVAGNWTNNGTFNGSPTGQNGNNNEKVTFTGPGTTIGGSAVSHFCNLTINPGAGNTVTIFSNSVITLQSGTLDVGVGHSINSVSQQGGSIVSTGGDFKSYGPSGWNLNLSASFGATFNTTGTVTLDNVVGLGTGGNFGYSLQNNTASGLHLNGLYSVKGSQSQNWAIKGNAPIWGSSSTLYRDNDNQGFNIGNNGDLSWTANTGTIGVTPGFPNNVTLVNMGSSVFNNTGWHPTGVIGLNGALHIGDGTTNGRITLEDVTSFTSGGLIIDNNSLIIGPKTGIPFTDKGDFTLAGGTTGVFQTSGATINFAGSGTSGSPQVISTTGSSVVFGDMTVSNGTYVKLQDPASITGTLNLTSGYIGTTSSNLLTISNTSTSAINGGSATAYVDGPLAWSVPATTSGNYTFPIGNGGKYLPLTLSPNSTSGTTVTATAFNQNSGGTPDKTVTSISQTEYWSVTTSSPFTSGPLVSVTRPNAVAPDNALAVSSTSNGVYTAIGGTAGGNTISGGGIGTGSPAFVTMVLAPLSIVKLSGTNVTCNGTTGSLTVGGSGGTPAYQYSINGGAFQVSNTFSPLAPGNHTVSVKDNTGTIATDTLKVLGSIVINGNDKDVSICSGSSTTLTAANLQNTTPVYSWSTSLSGTPVIGTNAALTVSPTTTTKYYVTSKLYNNNKLVNGGFESGNTGFTSSYTNYTGGVYASTPGNNGYYKISNAGINLCQYFSITGAPNQTSLSPQSGGQYFIGDGATTSSKVWEETVSGLTAGEVYKFQFYYAAGNPDATRAVLRPTINGGGTLGDVTTTNAGAWTQATYTWTATGTSATVAITDMTATGSTNGNDFYLDNMEFLAPCTVTDSIRVIVSTATPGTVSANQTICVGATPAGLTLSGNVNTTIIRWEVATNAAFTVNLTPIASTATTLTGANTGANALPAGTYYFRVVESGCGTTIYSTSATITVTTPVTPTFTAIAAICSGATAPTLSLSSTNNPAITGTWNPSTISNTAGATHTFTPTAGQCATTTTLTTTVNPVLTPTVSCATTTTSSVQFNWTAPVGANNYTLSYTKNGGAATSGGTTNSTTYTVSALLPGDAIVLTVTPSGSGCYASGIGTCTAIACSPITVTVPANSSVCAGATIPLTAFVSSPAGATFAWTNSNPLIGLAASGTGQIPAFTATNTTGSAITATITVTPTIGLCAGTPSTYTITVNPAATNTLTSASGTDAQAICVNAALTNITYAIGGSATGATLTGNLPAGVSGSYDALAKVFTISGTPTSATGSPFNYTIATTGPCAVIATTGTIAVNPILTPTVSCGTSTNSSVQFTWTALAGAGNYSLSYTKNGGSPVNGGTIAGTSFSVSSLTPSDVIVLTVTPIGTGCYTPGTGTCTAIVCDPISVIAPPDFVVCKGENVLLTSFTSSPAGATFTWTNSNSAIGLAASGTGDVPAFTAVNNGTTDLVATIIITPKIGLCSGTSNTYSITVNPEAINTYLSGQGIQTVCINEPMEDLVYTIDGSATGAILGGTIPAGVSGTYNALAKTFTVSGTPTESSTTYFAFTITTTGPCPSSTTGGVLYVHPIYTPVVTCGASSNTSVEFIWTATTGATGYSLSYTKNGGSAINAPSTTDTSYVFNALTPGDVILLTVTPTGAGCFEPATATCTAIPCSPITVSVPADTSVCAGITIAGTNFVSSPAGATFTWTNSNALIGIAVSGTGQISSFTTTNNTGSSISANITVTPKIGACTGTPNTYKITVNPTITPTFDSIPSFCIGTTAPTLLLTSTNSTAINGTWNPAVINNSASGNYTFTPDAGTCAVTKQISVTVADSFQIDAGEDVIVCSGENVNLTATSSATVTYLWINDSSRKASITVAPTTPTTYIVEASNGYCTAIDSVKINFKDSIAPTLYIPNAFTPNEDGLNDVFKVYGEGVVEFEGNIFNRWGELLYHWESIEGSWNGKSKANDYVMTEVYVYTIKVKNECQKNFEHVRMGSVTMIK